MNNTLFFREANKKCKSILLLSVSCLFMVALSTALAACSNQSSTTSAQGNASSSSASSYNAVAGQYEGYSSEVKFDLGVFRSSSSYDVVSINGESKSPAVEAASIQVVLLDAYGNALGSYDLQFNQKEYGQSIASGKIKGAKGAAEAYGLVYAYKLSDGTKWGNSKASSSEIAKYGHRIEVDFY